MDDKNFKLLKMTESDLFLERMKSCMELMDEFEEDYYAVITHQKLEEAMYFYQRFLETFADSDI